MGARRIRSKRALRFVWRSSLALLAVVLWLGVVVYGSLRSGLITDYVDRIVTLLAKKEGVFFVHAEGVSGNLPEHVRAKKVEVGDAYGVWLTIENVEASWHPIDLFHAFDPVKWRIQVDDAHAERIVWTRLPRDGPDEEDEPFHWNRFIRLIVRHIAVDNLELSGDILDGHTSRVRAEGSAVLGEWDTGFVKLDIEHVDGVEGSARIDLKTHGSPLELTGTITAEEGPGGALASLARLDDAGRVKLEVRGSGPMRDWHGEADIDAENIGVLKAETRLSFNAQGPFEASASFDPVPAQRERWLVGEGAPMALTAKGAWAPDVELRLDRVLLTADGRELSAKGRLDLATLEFDVTGRLAHAQQGELVRTTLIDVTSAALEGRGVLGDGGRLEATLELDDPAVAGVRGSDAKAVLRAKDASGESAPDFELKADAAGLSFNDGPMPLFGQTARLQAAGRIDLLAGVVEADSLHLDGDAIAIAGPLAIRDEWKSLRTTLSADASSLASLDVFVDAAVAGTASAALEMSVTQDWRDFDLDLRANASGVTIGESGWNALIGSSATLHTTMRGRTRGPARGELQLVTAGIDANARVDVGEDGKNLTGEAKLRLDNLSRLAEPTRAAIAGRVEATATARGSLEQFDVDLALHGDRVSFEGVRFDALDVDALVRGLPETWSGELHSRGRYGQSSASLDAQVAMPARGRLSVRGLSLRGPKTTGSGDLEIDLERQLASGKVELASEELALWRPMTGVPLGGAVRLDLDLSAAGSTQQVSGTALVHKGIFPMDGGDVFVESLDGSAQALEIGAAPRGSARVHAVQVKQGSNSIVDAVVTASGDGTAWNIDAKLDARQAAEVVRVDAGGRLAGTSPLELQLARAKVELGRYPIVLKQPASVRIEDASADAWSVTPLALAIGSDGVVTGQASRSRGLTHVEAEMKGLPLGAVSVLVPSLDLVGTIDGHLLLDGSSLLTSAGDVSLRGHDVASTGLETQGVEAVDLQADFRLGKGRISGAARVAGLEQTRLEVAVDAPLASASSGDPVVVDLTWKGRIAQASALLPFGEDVVDGNIDAKLRLTGSVAAPRVTGRAVVDGGRWENASTGLVLQDLHAELAGSGTALELVALTAGDGEGGSVKASGRARFEGFPAFDVHIDLEASDAMLSRLDLIATKADATIAVDASRGADKNAELTGIITGQVRIEDARVEIPQRFVADVPEIHVVEVGTAAAKSVAEAGPPRGVALKLDIGITGEQRIFVTGRGLESEWSSDAHLLGDTSDPRVHGTVKSVRGELSLLGRRFEISSATLRFDGGKGNVPYLTLTARAEANDITAIADVVGPATNPTIELRSEPPLPRDEVLSRLLFGQSAASLSAMQSVQLARSLAELTGSPFAGGGFLTGIGRTLGFDRLDIESSGASGGAALTASRYLMDDVYLRVQQGLTPETSKLSLEWRVMKHITIDGDVSQDAEGEVGATWRWDY